MKLLLIPLFALVLPGAGCSKKPSDEQMLASAQATIHGKCTAAGKALPQLSAAKLEQFCACSTERVLVALGAAGVRILSKSGSLSDTEKEMTRDASAHCAAQLGKS